MNAVHCTTRALMPNHTNRTLLSCGTLYAYCTSTALYAGVSRKSLRSGYTVAALCTCGAY